MPQLPGQALPQDYDFGYSNSYVEVSYVVSSDRCDIQNVEIVMTSEDTESQGISFKNCISLHSSVYPSSIEGISIVELDVIEKGFFYQQEIYSIRI